jgi:Holliday junction DNA helicase RuvB
MNELRPTKLKDILGQSQAVQTLETLLGSARARGDVLPHMLFDGPPGLGKTTLAGAVANEYNSKLYQAIGGSITTIKDLMPCLMQVKRGDILFIDEIHNVNKKVQECLFTVMEDFRLDIGRGLASFDFDPFTIVGATTDAGRLLKPFRDRFNIKVHLHLYDDDALAAIAESNASKLNIKFSKSDDLLNLAKACRGTPRIVNNYLKWIRDWSIHNKVKQIDSGIVTKALEAIGVDQEGLDDNDRMYIHTLRRFGKPVGLRTLVSATCLSQETIEHVIEPYLIKLGKLEKTSRGRSLL